MYPINRLYFNLWYFFNPPWDTGVTPPELMAYIQTKPAGRALDLGCGTGTNAITLAKFNWKVIGVDFASRAIKMARSKARQEHVDVEFYIDDVIQLRKINGTFDLILDIGCFHSIELEHRQAYIANLARLLDSQGTYMLYAFLKRYPGEEGPGIDPDEIKELSHQFQLIDRKDGSERGVRPSTWIIFRNSTSK